QPVGECFERAVVLRVGEEARSRFAREIGARRAPGEDRQLARDRVLWFETNRSLAGCESHRARRAPDLPRRRSRRPTEASSLRRRIVRLTNLIAHRAPRADTRTAHFERTDHELGSDPSLRRSDPCLWWPPDEPACAPSAMPRHRRSAVPL